MKELKNLMHYDFVTARPIGLLPTAAVLVIILGLGLFITPMALAYGIFLPMLFVIPTQATDDKSGIHKLYGILPVHRKNIVRARFLYIYLLHFAAELLIAAEWPVCVALNLHRMIGNTSELMQAASEMYKWNTVWGYLGAAVGMFSFFALMFLYMEMMGQIFGRENEFKIIMITLAVGTVLAVGYFWLADRDIIPTHEIHLPATNSGKLVLLLCVNAVVYILAEMFAKITESVVCKREL